MSGGAVSVFFALCVLLDGCCGKLAILGESVELKADVKCDAQEFSLIYRLRDDSPRTVAQLVNAWEKLGESYRERVEQRSMLSLWLTCVNYNYEFTFAGQLVTTIQLEVLIISNNNLSVPEGDTLTLPCYFHTEGDAVESLVWERDGELVLNQSLSSGEVRHGTGFEGRASMRSDWFVLGDLSLTVERVQLEDRGDFFCCVNKGSRQRGEWRERGSPAAMRVTVSERSTIISSTSAPPTREAETHTAACVTPIIITAVITLLLHKHDLCCDTLSLYFFKGFLYLTACFSFTSFSCSSFDKI
ncbi:uncharacterized protein LOC102077875 [Oreochromis niloticus]|uniref:uncharacterized protein LOC102077875 n=1 Tax=Oreochromis niloticus TaxID=8128 RepID=UPI0009053F02|nr:uncharacterized protein LOC102077875 [Oreochromis niloticus]CAI5671575.1 unnamed protein product [Mustela putorius furo]